MTTWEYATIPLLTHATKQILDQWGADGWELVQVVPGPTAPPSWSCACPVRDHEGRARLATCDDADPGRGARTRRGRRWAVRPHVFSARELRS